MFFCFLQGKICAPEKSGASQRFCPGLCPEGFCEKVFLEILQNLQENICAGVSFLIKLQAGVPQLNEKEAPVSCFPLDFAKCLRIAFYRTPSSDYFCSSVEVKSL